ncbi:MAG: 23S rRNA (pseudouridine(1915)-N(3))-methyltransferase RlmH [Tenuifilaceae bacterium]
MKISLIVVGKTDKKYFSDAIAEYEKRLPHYCRFEVKVIPDVKSTKSMSSQVQMQKEGEQILGIVRGSAEVVLLDDKGKEHTSVEFAKFLEKKMISGQKDLTFVIGGPYGFSSEVVAIASSKLSLSKMTFSHQLVRLIFIEQLYRAMTIIKGEPYHHE